MLSSGSIQFYINGPPPIARSTGPPSLDDFPNLKTSNLVIPQVKTDDPQEKLEESQNLNLLITQTYKTLLTIKSMKIFDFFPDKLIIDENKVSFIYKYAFGVRSIHSVLIENITYVEAHTSLLTGTLVVKDSSNYRHPIELRIDNLRKDAAIRARKLIQGLVHAKTLKMDFSQLTSYDLECNLEELGRVIGED